MHVSHAGPFADYYGFTKDRLTATESSSSSTGSEIPSSKQAPAPGTEHCCRWASTRGGRARGVSYAEGKEGEFGYRIIHLFVATSVWEVWLLGVLATDLFCIGSTYEEDGVYQGVDCGVSSESKQGYHGFRAEVRFYRKARIPDGTKGPFYVSVPRSRAILAPYPGH